MTVVKPIEIASTPRPPGTTPSVSLLPRPETQASPGLEADDDDLETDEACVYCGLLLHAYSILQCGHRICSSHLGQKLLKLLSDRIQIDSEGAASPHTHLLLSPDTGDPTHCVGCGVPLPSYLILRCGDWICTMHLSSAIPPVYKQQLSISASNPTTVNDSSSACAIVPIIGATLPSASPRGSPPSPTLATVAISMPSTPSNTPSPARSASTKYTFSSCSSSWYQEASLAQAIVEAKFAASQAHDPLSGSPLANEIEMGVDDTN